MERAAIEARIRVVSSMLAKATKIEDLKFFNRLIERLVMMQSDEEKMKSLFPNKKAFMNTQKELMKELFDDDEK